MKVNLIDCFRCTNTIYPNQSVIAIPNGHYYHQACFNCLDCRRSLRKGELYGYLTETDEIYCEEDFRREISSRFYSGTMKRSLSPQLPPPTRPLPNSSTSKVLDQSFHSILVDDGLVD
ncbi:LIM and coleoptericin domain containing protein [Sarcoptes scabiei]|uniref:LIM and coleoptericin domain containing protein n=1 Tax=Sarcoptes scabiei TaxID=52283 RepID=A0A131ZZB9_SARSC|nr:LIM and coleoptericin domain containing protein [Sarcoptes scabiei]